MKKWLIILLTALIIILFVLIFFLSKYITGNIIAGNVIKEQETNLNSYMYTKAICNESNYCQDYEITCQENQTKSIMPITGAVIQHSQDWEDPRNETDKNKLC